MKILDREISPGVRPYVIAEISGNHMGRLDLAMELVRAAAASGADAVKLQTYTADTITMDCDLPDFQINDEESLWNGRTLYELYEEAHTPWAWHQALFAEARKLGIHIFSSPFDETAVDLLEELGAPCYKIASFEHTFVPLLKKVAGTGKPIIISCGMASIEDIKETYDVLTSAGAKEICFLACTSTYPAMVSDSNLARIPALRAAFPACQVGLSDHTIGNIAALTATALGATVIEKHFKLDTVEDSVDGAFSATPAQMRDYTDAIAEGWSAIGQAHFGAASSAEERSKGFRRSIYVTADVAKGEVFTPDNIRCIRPGFGMHTKHFEDVIGKTASKSLTRGAPLSFDMIKD